MKVTFNTVFNSGLPVLGRPTSGGFRMTLSRLRLGPGAAALLGVLIVAGAAACSDDDKNESTPTPDGGPTPGNDSGPSPGNDSGPGTDAGSDTGTDGAAPIVPKVLNISPTGHDRFYGITYDAAGNLYASGQKTVSTDASDDITTIVAKITPAGALDTTWGTGGIAEINMAPGFEQARGVVVQSTGKIVVAATMAHVGGPAADRDVGVARFNANGTVDDAFGTMGVVTVNLSDPGAGTVYDSQWGLALGPSDSIVVEGSQKAPAAADSDFAVIKLAADGTAFPGFGNTLGAMSFDVGGRDNSARNVTVLPDGTIFATGYYRDGTDPNVDPVLPVIIKIKPDNDLDDTWGTNGIYSELVLPLVTEVYAIKPQGTKFVTAGYGRANATESVDWLSLRFDNLGARDMSWGDPATGIARSDLGGQTDNARNLLVLPDNRVLVVGGGRTTATEQQGFLAMYTATGQPDISFGPKGQRSFEVNGPSDHFWGASLSPDGTTIAVGGLTGGKDGGNDDAVVYLMPVGN